MEIKSDFFKGLQRDASVVLHQPSTYYYMENMRLVSTEGLATGNPENIRGMLNEISTLPIFNTSNVVLITQAVTPDGSTQTVDINGVTITFAFTSTWEDNLATAINADATLQLAGIHAAFKVNRVVVYSLLINNTLVTPLVTITQPGAFFNIDNSYVLAQSNLFMLGWEVIRDEIFIFTCQDPGDTSGQIWKFTYDKIDPTTSVLQILYHNALDLSLDHPIANPGGIVGNYENSSTIKLYWTDNFNQPRVFNTADPNAMALDPNLLNLQALTKFSIPILQQVLSGGSLRTGLVQYAYRLSISTGQESVYSQCSSLIPVNSHNEATETYIKYLGVPNDTNSGKSIRMSINNLDTNYERIQVIALVYLDSNSLSVPTIEIIKDELIPDTGVYTFVHTGTEIGIPVTIEEFNIINTVILRCKTLASKNNFLFPGNIKEGKFDVNWDGRAYRWNSTTAEVIDKLGNSLTVDPFNPDAYPDQWGINETFDAINPNQDPNSISTTLPENDPYLYQSDLQTFGGEGPNVKYTFTTQNTYLDTQTTSSGSSVPTFQVTRTGQTYTFDNYTRVNQSNTFKDFHSPYLEAQLKGYTRGEVYRFGIVFFDSNGNQSYVKWIGDVQIPHAYMPDPLDPLNPLSRQLTYPLTKITGNLTEANNLGVSFQVSNIPSGVSGFSIVRCERTSENKSILGQGILNAAYALDSYNRTYLVDDGVVAPGIGSSFPFINSTTQNGIPTSNFPLLIPSTPSTINGKFATMVSPEFLFNIENFSFNQGDIIEVIAKAENVHIGFKDSYNDSAAGTGTQDCTISPGVSASRHLYYTKNYRYSASPITAVQSVGGASYVGYIELQGTLGITDWAIQQAPFDSGLVLPAFPGHALFNLSQPRPLVSVTTLYDVVDTTLNLLSQGLRTLVLGSDSGTGVNGFHNLPNWYTSDAIINTADMWICNYKRAVQNQYGGNSYSERSNSEYIHCGEYQPIDINNIQPTYTFGVFGGDTYINIFDTSVRKKHFTQGDGYDNFDSGVDPRNIIPPPSYVKTSPASALMRFFPVETTVNIDLRQTSGNINFTCSASGSVPNVAIPNKVVFDDFVSPIQGVPLPDVQDEFVYNEIYSRENNIRKYFPKPTTFLSDGVYDTRVRFSKQKINNEETDSWTQFAAADYKDLDTIQGELNNLIVHQDRLVSFQDKGIAVLAVLDRSLIQDNSGAELVLGSGDVLQRYDYISKVIGSQHQFGFTQSNDAVFFFDVNTKSIHKLSGNSPMNVGIAKGLSSYLFNNLNGLIQTNDNPYRNKGLTCTYDFKYNEALFTFRDDISAGDLSITTNFTVSYNDFIDAWQSFYFQTPGNYSVQPVVYVNDKRNIFSSTDDQTLWIHDLGPYGSFYGSIYRSMISILINQSPEITKVFDSFQMTTEVTDILGINIPDDTFDSIKVYNDFQDSDTQVIPGTTKVIAKRVERLWNISGLRSRSIYNGSGVQIGLSPTDIPYGERMRGQYLFADLIYNNTDDRRLVLNTFKTQIRLSSR